MGDPIDRGLPFDLGDLWNSSLSVDAGSQHDSLFESLDTALPPLELPKQSNCAQFELEPIIPELEDQAILLEPETEALETAPKALERTSEDIGIDTWDLEGLLKDSDEHRLCTWEAFGGAEVLYSERTALISEAGPAAFDAAINLLPELRNNVGVLPQDYALRAFCNLALGRSSTLFQWSPKAKRFEHTLKGASVTGISQKCSESVAENLIQVGSTTARLRAVAERNRFVQLPAASLALRSCITSILNAIDESISEQLGDMKSILQLQNLVAVPQCLLSILDSLVDSAKDCTSDEGVISSISDRIYEEAQTEHDLCPVLRALLARVSVPWLEHLAADIGFCSIQTALAAGYQSGEAESRDLEQATSFMSADDRVLIHETKQAIRLLRSQDEYHPLLEGDNQAFLSFVNSLSDRNGISDTSKGYELKVMSRLRNVTVPTVRAVPKQQDTSLAEAGAWEDEPSQQAFFQQTAELMSSQMAIGVEQPADLLHQEVLSLCRVQTRHSPVFLDLAADLSTTPLERIRPLIQTQQRLANGILLRRLFRQHSLKRHLEVQKSFQLLGNGDFILRLSTALFSQETQSAERRRGATLTGEVMGLRLGATHEERWPPASSELQLTLMGILNETYGRLHDHKTMKSSHDQALPGALSFAIRQLPEAEIDRVLDPNSVYALDFLRLQYTAGPPLNAILTTDALDKYDGIFRFLLRLLRVIHVAANLQKAPSLHKYHDVDVQARSFSEEANHFVGILMSHVMELAIHEMWRTFLRSIEGLVQLLSEEDAAGEIGTRANMSVEALRRLHDDCLERIRSRLFLKRKQEKMRKAVEETLDSILKNAFALQRNDPLVRANFEDGRQRVQQSIKQICKLLQEHADKPLKTNNAEEAEDLEVNKILLSRLNWNGYYD